MMFSYTGIAENRLRLLRIYILNRKFKPIRISIFAMQQQSEKINHVKDAKTFHFVSENIFFDL